MSNPSTLSVIGFASGSPLSRIVLSRIAREHRLLGILAPPRPKRRFDGLRRLLGRAQPPLREIGVPLLDERQVADMTVDVLVVASFPKILPQATLARAKFGGLNVHTAPLPRHRGPDPIFWTYMDDDAEAGVTIHWIDAGIDTGAVAAMETLPLARGRPSRELYFDLAERAANLVSSVLNQVAQGTPPRLPQRAEGASYQSAKAIAAAQIPFADWPSERVWHTLHGLGDQFTGLVHDHSGARLPHGQATAYRLTSDARSGDIDVTASGFELHCRDGIVALERRR